jgi:hypothetical protein
MLRIYCSEEFLINLNDHSGFPFDKRRKSDARAERKIEEFNFKKQTKNHPVKIECKEAHFF